MPSNEALSPSMREMLTAPFRFPLELILGSAITAKTPALLPHEFRLMSMRAGTLPDAARMATAFVDQVNDQFPGNTFPPVANFLLEIANPVAEDHVHTQSDAQKVLHVLGINSGNPDEKILRSLAFRAAALDRAYNMARVGELEAESLFTNPNPTETNAELHSKLKRKNQKLLVIQFMLSARDLSQFENRGTVED